VDRPEIDNDTGPYGLDMLGFTEGSTGLVDQVYGAVIFPASSFNPEFRGKAVSLAEEEALAIRTYNGFVPDQKGYVYFYIETAAGGYLSPPFSYTEGAAEGWGEKMIVVHNPREIAWTELRTVGNTALVAGNRPTANPDFDAVTAIGFFFHGSATSKDKNAVRFLTDFFGASAK
jgi:hypothetical protein